MHSEVMRTFWLLVRSELARQRLLQLMPLDQVIPHGRQHIRTPPLALSLVLQQCSEIKVSQHPLEEFCDRSVLSGLLHQRLVPVLCDKCKLSYLKVLNDTEGKILTADQKKKILPSRTIKQLEDVLSVEEFAEICVLGLGCDACGDTGINKQTVVAEVVEIDDNMLRFFRKGDMESAEEYWLSTLNGRTFIEHALDRIKAGQIDPNITSQRLNVPLNSIPASRKKGVAHEN